MQKKEVRRKVGLRRRAKRGMRNIALSSSRRDTYGKKGSGREGQTKEKSETGNEKNYVLFKYER